MEKSGTIVVIILVAIVAWVLLNKTSASIAKVNQSVKQTYTSGTAAAAIATSAAPALGTFLSNLAKGFGGGGSSSGGGADFSYSSDDLATPSFSDGGSSFADDTSGYASPL